MIVEKIVATSGQIGFILFSCASKMNDWSNDMRSLGEAFAALNPQLIHASSMVHEELRLIKEKEEGDIRERFGRKIDEYKVVSSLHLQFD